MTLPAVLISIRLWSLSTIPAPTIFPVRVVSFMAATPLPPRPFVTKWSVLVRLPRPRSATTSKSLPGDNHFGRDDAVAGIEANADDSGGGTAHGTHVGLSEADCLTALADEHDVIFAARHAHPGQLVLGVDADSDQP